MRHAEGSRSGLDEIDELNQRLRKLAEIGVALSSERDLPALLERILTEARGVARADAGTIYLVGSDARLEFAVVHNESLGLFFGGPGRAPIPDYLRPFTPDREHVSGYAALVGETVNIPDAYEAEGFDFQGARSFDQQTGYRTQSVIVVPMKQHEGEVVGVLQLLNARGDGGEVVPFSADRIVFIESLASQAAVALTNAQLIQNLEGLFESLIQVMAKAVDEKDPTTAGHIARVTLLSGALARCVSDENDGALAAVRFSDDELNELRIAGWLHDIGKLTTPEWVINKGKKLEALVDRIALLEERFRGIAAVRRAVALEEKVGALQSGADPELLADIDRRLEHDLTELDDELEFMRTCNEPGEFLPDERLERLKAIATKRFTGPDGIERPYVTEDELANLSIRKGSITPKELQIMREHVSVTIRMLELVPFTRKLAEVPRYAGQHHEMLDGSGYPARLTADDLPVQSRILAICDVFDALSASDRPYKKAFSLEQSIAILRQDAERGRLDAELVELFVKRRVWEQASLFVTDGAALP